MEARLSRRRKSRKPTPQNHKRLKITFFESNTPLKQGVNESKRRDKGERRRAVGLPGNYSCNCPPSLPVQWSVSNNILPG